MGVQVREDASNVAFILGGDALTKENETVPQDGGRSGDMLVRTVMSYNADREEWQPFTSGASVNGDQFPAGILLKTLTEAEIQAGAVVGVPILVGNAIVAADQLVFENATSLTTLITKPIDLNIDAEQSLRWHNIYVADTIDITEQENV